MKITITPTRELYDVPINGQAVPTRIWSGVTEGGVVVEAYVISIVPVQASDTERLRAELPDFMVRSRQMYRVGDNEREPLDADGDGRADVDGYGVER